MSKPGNDSFSIEGNSFLPMALPFLFRKRAVRFFSVSLFVHLGGILALGHSSWLDYGLKDGRTSQGHMPVISAFMALESHRDPGAITEQGDGMNSEPDKPMKPANVLSPTDPDERQLSGRSSNVKTADTNRPASVEKTITQNHGYYPIGSLTRLPAPLDLIDLNVSPINNRAAAGPVQITLYIDANGNVSQIDGPNQDEKIREFYELIASRFRDAHFSPGEIDGRKVNSQITITIVSEPA